MKEEIKDEFSKIDKIIEENQSNLKDKIIDIINDNQYWQPHGEKGGIEILEEEEPFWWRINPTWVEEKANRLLELFKEEINK